MMRTICCLVLAALAAGCSTTPIGVSRVPPQELQRSISANAVSAGTASEWSRQVLQREGLFQRHATDPRQALEDLYRSVQQRYTPETLFALSELSFLYARRYQRRDYYLSAALFAYAFLLPEDEKTAVLPIDPRARLALDIYNQSLAEGLTAADGEHVVLEPTTHHLPFGSLTVTTDPAQFLWAGYRFQRFVSAANYEVRGLRNRYRQPGVGAPLVAEFAPIEAVQGEVPRGRISPRTKVPVTVFLRIAQPLEGVLRGSLEARLELYTTDHTTTLRIGGRDVPLEFESTTSIAYQLEGAPVWDTEIAGFRYAEAPVLGDGLVMLQPYRPGRIPVILVHGTASSPARWAEMYNELSNDPELSRRYQFWLFQYNTGQPVLYSARLLRGALAAAVRDIDRTGDDAALRRMVVIGHSQGGLLTKLLTVRSGSRFWDNVSTIPFDRFEAPADARTLFQDSMFFEPVPEIERVIFIATPHRGSFLAVDWVATLMRQFITMPSRLVQNEQDLAGRPEFAGSGMDQLPTSVDNMRPNTKFSRTLADLPIDPRIKAHSIIPVVGSGPPDDLDDGVVSYRSARIEGAESELVVRSSHSAQSQPETIEEVRRILRLHARDGTKVR